jgi:uncharacterized lipoprotein YddW (UPF0748 family)
MQRLLFTLFFFSCLSRTIPAQTAPVAEMRGAWIATVVNIDWPSAPGLPPERQRMEFDSILDALKAMGMNAIFVQIRPAGDALYPSRLAPWSKYLTGQQGRAPEPYYDPLEYMIQAAHQRRMEFHAWMNPYRASFDLDTASLAPSHPLRALPKERLSEWCYQYGGKYYFNPASPVVRQYLVNIILDLVLRYDIDGVQFDDFFYPYPVPGQTLNDLNQYAADPRGFSTIEDWRRDNVNRLIEDVSNNIKRLKPYVRFGISPFGVWRNADKDPLNGSPTRAGITSYDDLYADVLFWLQKGWIDYAAPQLYWSIGYPPADYQQLLDWWTRHAYGRHIYIGHAAYKIKAAENDPNWYQPDQLSRQIALSRMNAQVQGSLHFSAKALMRNPMGVQDSLTARLYNKQAMLPAYDFLSPFTPVTPQICGSEGTPTAIKLAWNTCELLAGGEMPYYFGIYRFRGDKVGDFKDPANLLAMTAFNSQTWTFEDQSVKKDEYYTYVVTAYNRFHAESSPGNPLTVKKTGKGMKKKRKLFGLYL